MLWRFTLENWNSESQRESSTPVSSILLKAIYLTNSVLENSPSPVFVLNLYQLSKKTKQVRYFPCGWCALLSYALGKHTFLQSPFWKEIPRCLRSRLGSLCFVITFLYLSPVYYGTLVLCQRLCHLSQY